MAAIVGPWGGFAGGSPFDDGWSNGGVCKLTVYYASNNLNGFRVVYGNGTTVLHGSATGTAAEVDFGANGVAAADISLTVGENKSIFHPHSNYKGVLAMGVSSAHAPQVKPSGMNGHVVRPQILGFFGRQGTHIDSLGFYISDPRFN